MKNDRGIRSLSILAILVALVALSVGYAALSQTLDINGTTEVKQTDWNIQFENLVKPTAENGGLVGSATETSSALSVTTLTFSASLTKPGDMITYTWDVINNGDIDAKLSAAPVLNGLDVATAAHVTYTFTYSDGTSIGANDELKSKETKHLKLVVAYDETATETATADTSLSLTTTLTYIQK